MKRSVSRVVSLTHGKEEMKDLCTAYCLAIKALTKNAHNANRANEAQNVVQTFALKSHPIVNEWFLAAR